MATSPRRGRRTGRYFTIDTEMVEVLSLSDSFKIDPAWRWTDPYGHTHEASSLDETTEWSIVESYWCQDCHEEHYEHARFCRVCASKVEPKMVLDAPAGRSQYIPGMTIYKIDGENVDEATFRRELDREEP